MMGREQQQGHVIRLVAEYLDDNLEFANVYEDEDLADHEDTWQEIHNLCGMILDQLPMADPAFWADFAWRLLMTVWVTVVTVWFWRDRRRQR